MSIYTGQHVDPLLIVEGSVFTLALLTMGNSTHYTWWAILGYVVSTFATAVLPGAVSYRLDLTAVATSVFVTLAVPVLSAIECTLFVEAMHENGSLLYVIGNWLLHFWPSVRLLRRVSMHPNKVKCTHNAVRLFALYVAIQRPSIVYKCPSYMTPPVFPIAGISVLFIIEYVISIKIQASHNAQVA